MERRDFLKSAAIVGGASLIGLRGNVRAAEDNKTSIKRYNEIGKTGVRMSDISFGAGKLNTASLVARALDRGINYFDTAPDYGTSEEVMGEAIEKLKKRDKMIITSKFCSPLVYPSHLKAGSSVKEYIGAVEGSLRRLRTDYLDFALVHAMGEMEETVEGEKNRLLDENLFTAAEQLQKSGKIRFLGVSSHGPKNMEPLLLAAVESGRYAMIMMAFNFMKFPKIPDVLKKAKEKGVGVIAMKTLAGAKDANFDPGAEKFEPAALKWVLKHDEVSGLVVTIKSVSDIALFLPASGVPFSSKDQAVLETYEKKYTSVYCRTGCGDCIGSCPSEVNIPVVLRYKMYFEDYGMEKMAMESYTALSGKASSCETCADEACMSACPYGLNLPPLLKGAHKQLTLS